MARISRRRDLPPAISRRAARRTTNGRSSKTTWWREQKRRSRLRKQPTRKFKEVKLLAASEALAKADSAPECFRGNSGEHTRPRVLAPPPSASRTLVFLHKILNLHHRGRRKDQQFGICDLQSRFAL